MIKVDGIILVLSCQKYKNSRLKEFALSNAKSGANVSYFDNGWKDNEYGFENISYDYIPVKPEEEGHICTDDVYNMPKVVI